MKDLTGHVALVTGGGRDIGEAIALQLASAGASVAVMSRTSWYIDQVACAINARGGNALAVEVNYTDQTDIANACNEVMKRFGLIDILVNNPVQLGPLGPFSEIDIEEWVYANSITLQGPVRLTRLLLPVMLGLGWGRIINVSSEDVQYVNQGETHNAYISSKAGVEAHTLNLATQLENSGVTANVVRLGSARVGPEERVEASGSSIYQRLVFRRPRQPIAAPEIPTMGLVDLIHSGTNGETVNSDVFGALSVN